jgi:hypothetical protein
MAPPTGTKIPVASWPPGCSFEDCELEAAWAAAAATAAAASAILGFVDLEGTAIEVLAVQGLHGAGCIGVRHFDEAEAAGPTRLTIIDQRNFLDRTVGGKQGAHGVFRCCEGKIANVQFSHCVNLTKKERKSAGRPASWFAKLYEGDGLRPERR